MMKLSDSGMIKNEYFILTCKEDDLYSSFEWRFDNKNDFDVELLDILNNLDVCDMFKIIGFLGDDVDRDAFYMSAIKESIKVVSDGNGVLVSGRCKFTYPICEGFDDKMFTTHEHYGDDFLCEIWNINDINGDGKYHNSGKKGIYIYLGHLAIIKFSMHD